MSVIPKFRGRIDNGLVIMDERTKVTFDRFLRTLEGEDVYVIVRKPGKDYPQRSSQENRYFHGVILPLLSDHLGYSKDEVKDILKARFLSETIRIKNAEALYIKPTSSLTTVEFEDFCEKVRMWAATDFECNIPLPNEADY